MNSKLQAMWIVGFVDGEGCFRASVIHSPKLRFQTQIQLEFVVVQHDRDIDLLYQMKSFFNCGSVTKAKGRSDEQSRTARFRVRKLSDLKDKVIPFFEQHSLKTKKKVEFLRFRELAFLLDQKTHLTEDGFKRCYTLAKRLPYESLESSWDPLS
jgi:hypothetical protein